MLAETLNHLLTQSYTWEIILVDDGSCDDTINVACKFAKSNNLSLDQDLRILKAEANRGKVSRPPLLFSDISFPYNPLFVLYPSILCLYIYIICLLYSSCFESMSPLPLHLPSL